MSGAVNGEFTGGACKCLAPDIFVAGAQCGFLQMCSVPRPFCCVAGVPSFQHLPTLAGSAICHVGKEPACTVLSTGDP